MIRIGLSLLALMIFAAAGMHPALIVIASAAVFLATFAAQHDLLHGALRVPRALRELLLSAAGAILLMSGHAVRAMHLRHHARIFAADDLEGAIAQMSPIEALLASPVLSIRLRLEALRTVNTRERRFMRAEHALNAATLLALPALFGAAGALYVATSVALQLTMPIWAGRIPHRPPAWMIACARCFAFTRSPTMLSLAFHELHHEHPRIPTAMLAKL
jgi:fatty acid desaturase